MKPLTNSEIDKIMTKYDNYRGTFSKDMLPKTMKKNEATVVNLIDYFAGDGTHWVCIYNDEKLDKAEYFDSFGLVPPNKVIKYMETTNKNIIYNDSQIQNMNSILCGYYCIYYISNSETKGKQLMKFYVDIRIINGILLRTRKKKNSMYSRN